jgi:hypothetical protein
MNKKNAMAGGMKGVVLGIRSHPLITSSMRTAVVKTASFVIDDDPRPMFICP